MSWGNWGFIDAPEVNYRLAMAWDEWAPRIQHIPEEKYDLVGQNAYEIHHDSRGRTVSDLSYSVHPDNTVSIHMLHVQPQFQGQGVAEALIRRLHQDYPNHKINPGSMTEQGQGFHDRMLAKEPTAKDVLARLAMAWQDWAPQIKNTYGGCEPGQCHQIHPTDNVSTYHIEHGDGDHSYLRYSHEKNSEGKPVLSIRQIYTGETNRHDGVAEALMRRLIADHPGHKIDPGRMTGHGQGFHDHMLQKEPDAKNIVAQANRIIEAMAWHEWSDKIVRRQEDEDYTGSVSGRYVIPQAGAFLDYSHDTHMGRPAVKINGIYTHPSNRGDGVAEALMRRLYEDHPDKLINPGYMTPDGQKFHDRMLDKEPTAKDLVTAANWILKKSLRQEVW